MAKYLDLNGLTHFLAKLKGLFVAKENGKGLSSNDFSDDDKAKLDGIGDNLMTTDTAQNVTGIKTFVANGAALKIKQQSGSNPNAYIEVQKPDGTPSGRIGLISTGLDQFTLEAQRGDLILAAQANVNVRNKKIINLANPTADLDAANKKYIDDKVNPIKAKLDTLNSIVQLKGRVDAIANLPATNNQNGDLYLVGSVGSSEFAEYIWDGTKWEKLGDTRGQITSYNALSDKPQINGVELSGNKSAANLGLLAISDISAITNAEIDALF